MYKKVDADFPNEKSVISGFGNVAALKHRFAEWGRNTPGYEDVAVMVPEWSSQPSTAAVSIEGFVYLIRSGAHSPQNPSNLSTRRVTLPCRSQLAIVVMVCGDHLIPGIRIA